MKAVQIVMIVLLAVVLAGCGTEQPTGTATHSATHGATSGTDHGGSHANDAPYDAQFIDGMTVHHQGAVAMAEQALKESQRPEIKQLAQNIIATQNPEIEQMATWRKQWYRDLPPTGGTGGHMGDMELSSDSALPFEQRFISAMISHHQGAIAMAQEAQTKAEHEEIKQFAQRVIAAQEAEVKQLQEWQKAWFNQ